MSFWCGFAGVMYSVVYGWKGENESCRMVYFLFG
jgi:hypothetical protein